MQTQTERDAIRAAVEAAKAQPKPTKAKRKRYREPVLAAYAGPKMVQK